MATEAGLTLPIRDTEIVNIPNLENLIDQKVSKLLQRVQKPVLSFQNELLKIFNITSTDTSVISNEIEKNKSQKKDKDKILRNEVKNLTIKEKLYKLYDKHIIRGRFFEKTLGFFKDALGRLKDMAGNWFMKILGFLLLMSILDPKGKMLKSILMTITRMVIWMIKIIVKMLPWVFKTIGNLIFDVFPDIIRSIVEAFGDAFGKNSIIYKFFHDVLPKVAPILLLLFLGLGLYAKIAGLVMNILPLFKGLIGVFGILIKMLSFIFMNPVGLVLLAIAAAFFLIYKYSDKIIGFFDGVWNWFKKLGIGWKILIGTLIIPLIPFISIIYNLAKLFSYIKKVGIKKTFEEILNWFKNFSKRIKEYLSRAWDNTLSPLRNVVDIITHPFNTLLKIFPKLQKVLDKIWNFMKDTILKGWQIMVDAFHSILDYIHTLSFGKTKALFGTSEEKSGLMSMQRYAREIGDTDISRMQELLKKQGKAATKAERIFIERAKSELGIRAGEDLKSEKTLKRIGSEKETERIDVILKRHKDINKHANVYENK